MKRVVYVCCMLLVFSDSLLYVLTRQLLKILYIYIFFLYIACTCDVGDGFNSDSIQVSRSHSSTSQLAVEAILGRQVAALLAGAGRPEEMAGTVA
jgi:hypothetical protein